MTNVSSGHKHVRANRYRNVSPHVLLYVVLVNLHGPNSDSPAFYTELKEKLHNFI